MPLAGIALPFARKHNNVYDAFIGALHELAETRDIETNLNRLYECLEYEQRGKTECGCMEYFLDNDVVYSIYGLRGVSTKCVTEFLVRIVVLVPENAFLRLERFFRAVFLNGESEELPVALAYSERVIVFGRVVDNILLEYVLRFFFDTGIGGECARACAVYLLCSETTFLALRNAGFIGTVIQKMNEMYLNLGDDVSCYLALQHFVSYYARKEAQVACVREKNKECRDVSLRKEGTLYSSKVCARGMRNLEFYSTVFDLLRFGGKHSIFVCRELLRGLSSWRLRKRVLESFIEGMESSREELEFVQECVEWVPELIAPYFINRRETLWSPVDVLERMYSGVGETGVIKVPKICHVERCKISIVDRLISSDEKNEVLFLFMWSVSRETFYSHFEQISKMFDGRECFWTSLWNMFLE